ncbi:citrate lyase holo-[acyl-carrier protein] synthase [Photobacterium carnosum]|uniref:citrate lyase holo-[acyl-carrier protein] synthase n=1 Tax=Photobacterium carnosum TaxID=2023717 RepID=UPI0022B78C67|nr:citrate lyase holo-[acyl-carrier protein] synthase [Photobacterium carnosum]MCD9496582.1 citrate lyase holo-[acyl-carrier protein] synthase [Photobacterium carnosum]
MIVNISESAVNLLDILTNNEARVSRQQEWLKSHSLPLISFTINMPGPIKMNDASKKIFNHGLNAIVDVCRDNGWLIISRQILMQKTGPEAIFAVDISSAMDLKQSMINIENNYPLGRLMDIDVIGKDGKIISRKAKMLDSRKCLLCEENAVICARSRRHTLSSLMNKIYEITFNDKYRY